MLVGGVTVEFRREDGSIGGAQALVLNFDDPDNNDWLAVNQFTVRVSEEVARGQRTGHCTALDIRAPRPQAHLATLLLGRSLHPKLIKELLGHATIAMTLDTYSHYLPSMGDQVAGVMGEALG